MVITAVACLVFMFLPPERGNTRQSVAKRPETSISCGSYSLYGRPISRQSTSHACLPECHDVTHLDYSGRYSFAPTEMYWALTHMVASTDQTLRCRDCHGDNGIMDWQALGYSGDPAYWGGRPSSTQVGGER
jgi:hypothetical protein